MSFDFNIYLTRQLNGETMKYLLIFSLLSFLTACGGSGGGGSTPKPEVPNDPPTNNPPPVIEPATHTIYLQDDHTGNSGDTTLFIVENKEGKTPVQINHNLPQATAEILEFKVSPDKNYVV